MYWRIWQRTPLVRGKYTWHGWYGVWPTREAAVKYYTTHPGNARCREQGEKDGWDWTVLPHDQAPTPDSLMPEETNLMTPEDEDQTI